MTLPDDALSPWLESLRPSTVVFCRAAVHSPWGFRIEAREEATFHILTRGEAILRVEGVQESLALREGDLVLLPGGAAHQLQDAPSSAVLPLHQAVASGRAEGKVFEFGGDGGTAVMVCGGCRLGGAGSGISPALLPPVVRHGSDPGLIRLVERESRGLTSGGEAVLAQILSLLVTQALRAHFSERDPAERKALLAPHLRKAVTFIHENLGEDVDMDDLCAHANLSRTALSERFQEILGVAPIQYLRMTRLSRAADLLKHGTSGLEGVARAVGYSSASTFSRAFRREYGVSPGAYRSSD